MIEIRVRLAEKPPNHNHTPIIEFDYGFCHHHNLTHLVSPVFNGSCYRCFVCGLYFNSIDQYIETAPEIASRDFDKTA